MVLPILFLKQLSVFCSFLSNAHQQPKHLVSNLQSTSFRSSQASYQWTYFLPETLTSLRASVEHLLSQAAKPSRYSLICAELASASQVPVDFRPYSLAFRPASEVSQLNGVALRL